MRRDQAAGFSTVVPTRTVAQSASSSSATSIARAVGAPWPISERSMVTVTVPSGAMASQAFGANGSAESARASRRRGGGGGTGGRGPAPAGGGGKRRAGGGKWGRRRPPLGGRGEGGGGGRGGGGGAGG